MNITVGFAEKACVAPLRQSVLGWGPGVGIPDDDLHTTRHLVAVTPEGDIVGAISCSLVAFPNGNGAHFGDSRSVRFWGLAVNPRYRNAGIGTQLTEAVVTRAQDLDATVVWAYSFLDAVPFYQQMNFDVFNESSMGSITGAPRKRIVLNLKSASLQKLIPC